MTTHGCNDIGKAVIAIETIFSIGTEWLSKEVIVTDATGLGVRNMWEQEENIAPNGKGLEQLLGRVLPCIESQIQEQQES